MKESVVSKKSPNAAVRKLEVTPFGHAVTLLRRVRTRPSINRQNRGRRSPDGRSNLEKAKCRIMKVASIDDHEASTPSACGELYGRRS